MPGHSVILVVSFGRQWVIRHRFDGFSMLHNHFLNDVIWLAVRLVIFLFLRLFIVRIVRPRAWSLVGNVNRLRFISKSIMLASKTGSASDMIDFDEHHFVALIICLVWRFHDGNWYVILPDSGDIFGGLFFLQPELYFAVSFFLKIKSLQGLIGMRIFFNFGQLSIHGWLLMEGVLSEGHRVKHSKRRYFFWVPLHPYYPSISKSVNKATN